MYFLEFFKTFLMLTECLTLSLNYSVYSVSYSASEEEKVGSLHPCGVLCRQSVVIVLFFFLFIMYYIIFAARQHCLYDICILFFQEHTNCFPKILVLGTDLL